MAYVCAGFFQAYFMFVGIFAVPGRADPLSIAGMVGGVLLFAAAPPLTLHRPRIAAWVALGALASISPVIVRAVWRSVQSAGLSPFVGPIVIGALWLWPVVVAGRVLTRAAGQHPMSGLRRIFLDVVPPCFVLLWGVATIVGG